MKITLTVSVTVVSKVPGVSVPLVQCFLSYLALYQYFSMILGAVHWDLMVKTGFLFIWYHPPLPHEPDLILDDCNDLSIKLLKP